MAKLSKIYHTSNLFGKRIFLFFLLLLTVNNFSFSQSTENQIKTIVLDAGHGGKDPGNLGTGRYKENEKEIALKVTLMVGNYISDTFSDVKVLYTREDDSYPTLRERTDLANNNNADLFISIHCDAFDKSSAHGTSSHVMGLDYSEKNLRVAQKENSVIYLEDNYQENYDGFDPNTPESYIIFSLTQNVYMDQSIQIANNVQKQFTERVKRKNRGVKQAPFWVTSRVNMPSVLIELGFLTNPDEEDFLHSEDGQIYMASAIFRAFKEYKETIDGLNIVVEESEPEDIKEIEISKDEDLNVKELKIVFKIQLATYLESMKNSSVFTGMSVEEIITNGTYRYLLVVGNDKKEADILNKIMSNKLKSVIVGIVSLLAIAILYHGIKFLKGQDPFKKKRVFHAYYEDIAGLTEGNAVIIKGYKVGTVTQISFEKVRDNQLKVVMTIEDDIQIPINSEAKIVSLDLMGTKGISLFLSDDTDMATEGSELNSAIEASLQDEVNAQILPLKNKTERLISSIDSVMTVITTVLNKDARKSLSQSLISLDKTFHTLSETMLVVDEIVNDNKENVTNMLTNFSSISDNLNQSNKEIKNILNNFSTLSDSLAKADILSTFNKIDKITNKINNSEGSLGELVNDKELYNNLKKASSQLEQLIEDLKLHPERYINFSIIGLPNKPFTEPE